MFIPIFSFGQNLESIVQRAILISHADYSDFTLTESNKIYEIVKDYKIQQLKSSEIVSDCYFFQITPLQCENCKMLIAYWGEEKRFFRLNGFRYNEFTQFFNFVILPDFSLSQNKIIRNTSKNRKLIFEEVSVENYELDDLYKTYYDKKGKLSLDTIACFFRSVIVDY